jgi:hypothetical protein
VVKKVSQKRNNDDFFDANNSPEGFRHRNDYGNSSISMGISEQTFRPNQQYDITSSRFQGSLLESQRPSKL